MPEAMTNPQNPTNRKGFPTAGALPGVEGIGAFNDGREPTCDDSDF
jgi:hypothetical protein